MPFEVFISYSRAEGAVQLGPEYKHFIDQKLRYKTFLDTDDITASAHWKNEIEEALQSDGLVKPYLLLIATPQAVRNPKNIADEVRIASEYDLPIIAIEYAPKLARELVGTNAIHFIEAHTEFNEYRLTEEIKRNLEHALDSHATRFLEERRRHAVEWSRSHLPKLHFWRQNLDSYFPVSSNLTNESVALLASGGSGKTVLTATKIDSLLKDASCYPIIIDPDHHHDLREGCKSILEQLHGASSSLSEKCEYWRNPPSDSHLAGRSRKVVFVVDGLDRFADPADPNQEGLLRTLNTLADAAPTYITCRKEVWDAWYQGKVSVESREIENLPREQVARILNTHTAFAFNESDASPLVSIPFFLDLAITNSDNWPDFPATEYKFLARVWSTITQSNDDDVQYEGQGRSWVLERIAEQQLEQLSYEVEIDPQWLSEKPGFLPEYAVVLNRLIDAGVCTVRPTLNGKLIRQRHDLLDNHVMVRAILSKEDRDLALLELCERCGRDCGWSLLSSVVQALHELQDESALAKLMNAFLSILDHKKFKLAGDEMTKAWAVTHVLKAKFCILFPSILKALGGQPADSLNPNDDSHVTVCHSTINHPPRVTQEAASTLGSAFAAMPTGGVGFEESIDVLHSCLSKFTYRGRFIEALARFKSPAAFEVLVQYANEQLGLLNQSPRPADSDPRSLLYLVQAKSLLLTDFDRTTNLLERIRSQAGLPAIVRRVATEALHSLDPSVELLPRTEEEILDELQLYEGRGKTQYTDWRIVTDYARYIRSTFSDSNYSRSILERLIEMLDHDQNFARREVALAVSQFVDSASRNALLNEILEPGIPSEVRQGCLQGLRNQLLRMPPSPDRQLYRLLLLCASRTAETLGQIVTSRGLLELAINESTPEMAGWLADAHAIEVIAAPREGFVEEDVTIHDHSSPGCVVARCIKEHAESGQDFDDWEPKYRITSLKAFGDRLEVGLAKTTWSLAQYFHEAIRVAPEQWLHADSGTKNWIEPLPLGKYELPGIAVVHCIAITADDPPQALLSLRSENSRYAPEHWSLSYEEQVTNFDVRSGAVFRNCALRGLEEEFGLPTETCTFKVLSALLELNMMNLGVIGLVASSLTASECEQIIRAKSNWETADVQFIEVSHEALMQLCRGDHPSIHRLHPTTPMRARVLERCSHS